MDRRQILCGLVAASTAALAGTSARSAVSENPKLLALGEQLEGTLSEYLSAKRARDTIYRETMKVWPRAPKEIEGRGDLERDVSGAGLSYPDSRPSLLVKGTTEPINIELPLRFNIDTDYWAGEVDRRAKLKSERGVKAAQKRLDQVKQAASLSETYWAEIDRLTNKSGYQQASDLTVQKAKALNALVHAILIERETTMTGVVIKAQATQAWGKTDRYMQSFNVDAPDWARHLSESLIRQARFGQPEAA